MATVKVVVKSFDNISTLQTEVENTQGLGAEVLLRAIMQHSFLFIVHLVLKVLSFFEPPNRLLQAKDMDLFTVVTLVDTASPPATAADATGPGRSKRKRTINKNLCGFTVEETVTTK